MLFAPLVSTVSIRSFRRVGQRVGQTRKPSAEIAPQKAKNTQSSKHGHADVILSNVCLAEITQFDDSCLRGFPDGFEIDVAIFVRNNIPHTSNCPPGNACMRIDKIGR